MSKEEILKEITKVKTELSMSNANDGWWNIYMEKKLENLKKKLEDVNNNILNT